MSEKERKFLEIVDLKKGFGSGETRQEVLRGMNFSVAKGEFCVLLGPSGSGKSTLLNIIGGIDSADSGYISIGKCADYVLKNRPNVVSIYIEAPRAFCVERTIANMGVTPEVANATIERTDKFRADYYKYYTHGNYWTNPVNYDLTLNSERVGVENCVKTIEQYLIIKGFIKADMIKPVGELI